MESPSFVPRDTICWDSNKTFTGYLIGLVILISKRQSIWYHESSGNSRCRQKACPSRYCFSFRLYSFDRHTKIVFMCSTRLFGSLSCFYHKSISIPYWSLNLPRNGYHSLSGEIRYFLKLLQSPCDQCNALIQSELFLITTWRGVSPLSQFCGDR